DLAESRGLSIAEMRKAANEMTGWKEEAAVTAGLVDGILRRTEMEEKLHDKVGFDYDEKLNFVGTNDYFKARLNKLSGGGDEVAVLIAEGSIVDGIGDAGMIGDKKYIKELEKLIEDDDVKAVVLRVNSGGGSASSSENIWYAAEKLKESGKPFVVSMGDYAASGGYYIAAGADSIFAEPTTITGSIGVFTVLPVLEEMLNDKLGINFDTINTARNATAFSVYRDVSEEQADLLTRRSESIYLQFMERVAEGRDIPLDRVKEIARGRVYSGVDALEINLVDRIGGVDEAIASAAKLAGLDIDEYSVGHYPRLKPSWERLINEIMGENKDEVRISDYLLREQLGEEGFEYYNMIQQMVRANGPQARLPLVLKF
ncbi:MAG: signal peptide peptidase SppA, partial [Bacteroidota bacterium]